MRGSADDGGHNAINNKKKRKRSDASTTRAVPEVTVPLTGHSPFWTPPVKELSQNLWLPNVADLHHDADNCPSTTLKNSWFSARVLSHTTTAKRCYYSSSELSSSLATTEGGPPQITGEAPARKKARTAKLSAGKSRRVRVYPTAHQRTILN